MKPTRFVNSDLSTLRANFHAPALALCTETKVITVINFPTTLVVFRRPNLQLLSFLYNFSLLFEYKYLIIYRKRHFSVVPSIHPILDIIFHLLLLIICFLSGGKIVLLCWFNDDIQRLSNANNGFFHNLNGFGINEECCYSFTEKISKEQNKANISGDKGNCSTSH